MSHTLRNQILDGRAPRLVEDALDVCPSEILVGHSVSTYFTEPAVTVRILPRAPIGYFPTAWPEAQVTKQPSVIHSLQLQEVM